jgi:hypothetical protein
MKSRAQPKSQCPKCQAGYTLDTLAIVKLEAGERAGLCDFYGHMGYHKKAPFCINFRPRKQGERQGQQ